MIFLLREFSNPAWKEWHDLALCDTQTSPLRSPSGIPPLPGVKGTILTCGLQLFPP